MGPQTSPCQSSKVNAAYFARVWRKDRRHSSKQRREGGKGGGGGDERTLSRCGEPVVVVGGCSGELPQSLDKTAHSRTRECIVSTARSILQLPIEGAPANTISFLRGPQPSLTAEKQRKTKIKSNDQLSPSLLPSIPPPIPPNMWHESGTDVTLFTVHPRDDNPRREKNRNRSPPKAPFRP